MRHGFGLGYKTWVHYGEPIFSLPTPIIDNTRQLQMSDMTALLNDLSYIPPNNKHNEPTQGDTGETNNEPTQATCNEFEELYASANEELYPGCDYDIDVYLRPLMEDMKVLWYRKGVETIDVASRQKFNMRAMVLWTINDFPARSSLSGWSGQDYKACPTCNKDTSSVRVLSKTAYVGHRIFLKNPYKWKSSLKFNGQTDNRDLPKEFGRDEILAQLDRLPTRVKAKPEGSIAEGYVAEEPLTFSSHYFQDVTTKFNRPDRNVDPLPQRVSFRCFDRPEIDTYQSQFKRHERRIPQLVWVADNDKDLEVSTTSELFALACGLTWTPISVNSCVVDDVRYAVHSRDERRTTQNSGICSPGPDEEMYYGQLQEILEFKYLLFKVVLFRVKWFDTRNQGRKVKCLVLRNNMTQIDYRDGQSMKVDAPPYIIDVPDEDDDIIDDEETLSHDLANSDDEDLINVDDDGVDKMSIDVARSHGGNSGDEDRPPHTMYQPVVGVASLTEAKANESLIWATGQRHFKKAYNTNKATFKAYHWVIDPETETYNGEKIRRAHPEGIMAEEWDKYIQFWNPGTLPEPLKIGKTGKRARSYLDKDPGRLLTFEMRWQSSATQEYPSLIDTFFVAYTVNGVFTRDKDRFIYEEMRRLEATGTYTDNKINRLARKGKQQGHISGVGRVLPARVTADPSRLAPESTLKSLHKKVDFMMRLFKSDSKYSDAFSQFESAGASGSGGSDGCGDDEESADDQEDEDDDGDAGSEGLAESKASTSNLRRIQVKDIVKKVGDYLKTYSSAEMDINLKAEMAILTKRIDDLTKEKSEKGKNEKGKADESLSMLIPEITSDSESECETQEPLLLSPKPIGPTLAGTSNSLMSMANLTLNMADPTLNTSVPKKTKPTSVNVSPAYVIKKRIENKSLAASGTSRLNSQSNSSKSTKKKTWKPRIGNKRSIEPTEKQVTQKDIAQSSVMESLSPGLLIKMKKLNEVKVKELRSDNGTEFKNHKLEEFCDARDQLGKFNEKVDDGFFLGYSLVAKAFSTERDAINFNENRSFPNDKFLEPRTITTQCPRNIEYIPYISTHEKITPTDSLIPQDSVFPKEPLEFTDADDHPALNEIDQPESADNLKLAEIEDNSPMNQSVMFNPYQSFHPQLKVSFNLLFLKIDGQEKSTSNWLTSLVNLWLVLQPKARPENQKLHQRMNAYMNKVWSLVPKSHGKTIVRTKWIWKYKMDENGVVIKNKARLVVDVFKKP
nr:hypothetical protein [Tanacetum cinerariifolium]